MHTFRDPATEVTIHHNSDYSGEAIMFVPLARVSNDFDPDPQHNEMAAFDITDEHGTAYGITAIEGADGRKYAQIVFPAMLLVRFAGVAMHDAITRELEQMDVAKLVGGGSL